MLKGGAVIALAVAVRPVRQCAEGEPRVAGLKARTCLERSSRWLEGEVKRRLRIAAVPPVAAVAAVCPSLAAAAAAARRRMIERVTAREALR
jgi:hypothetical protein